MNVTAFLSQKAEALKPTTREAASGWVGGHVPQLNRRRVLVKRLGLSYDYLLLAMSPPCSVTAVVREREHRTYGIG